jgi:hypothetical protein
MSYASARVHVAAAILGPIAKVLFHFLAEIHIGDKLVGNQVLPTSLALEWFFALGRLDQVVTNTYCSQ